MKEFDEMFKEEFKEAGELIPGSAGEYTPLDLEKIEKIFKDAEKQIKKRKKKA